MELLHRFPEGGSLNRTKFVENPKDTSQVFLTLGVNHEVDSKICDLPKGGAAVVKYIVHVTKEAKNVAGELVIDESVCPIADQTADELRSILNAIRPKSGHDISAYEQHTFDYRAFSYVLGAVVGKSVAGIELDLTTNNTVKAKTLNNTWNNPSAGDFLVCPSVIRNSREWGTFACLAGCAGARYITYMNDTLPASSNQLVLEELAAFCFRLQGVVLSVADSVGCCGHHELAFFRGLTASMKLHAHSDEGGWIRGLLSRATYPRPRGLLTPLAGSVAGLPSMRTLPLTEVTRVALAYLLRGSALIAAVDGDKNTKLPTILSSTGDGRPGEVNELLGRTYVNLAAWRSALIKYHSLVPESVGDVSSAKHYFAENKADTHLKHNLIVPFFLVEPSVVLPDMDFVLDRPVCPGKEVVLPMLSGVEGIFPNASYGEVNGRPIRDSKILLSFYNWRPRNSGISYLLNSQYNEDDGLALFIPHEDPRIPTKTMDLGFSTLGAMNMGEQRWLTPHNPIACPMESFSMGRVNYLYHHPGSRKYPSLADLKKGTVSSRCGDFFLTSPDGFGMGRTVRDIPPRIDHFFRTEILGEYDYTRSLTMDFIGLPNVIVPTPPPAPTPIGGGSNPESGEFTPLLYRAVEPEADHSLGSAEMSTHLEGLVVHADGPNVGLPTPATVSSLTGRQVAVRGDDEPGIMPRPPQTEAKPPNGSE